MDVSAGLEISTQTRQLLKKWQDEKCLTVYRHQFLKSVSIEGTERWIVADLILVTESKIYLFYFVREWSGVVHFDQVQAGWYTQAAKGPGIKNTKPSPVIEAQNRRQLLVAKLESAGLSPEDLESCVEDYVVFHLSEGSLSQSVKQNHPNVLTAEGFESFLQNKLVDKSWCNKVWRSMRCTRPHRIAKTTSEAAREVGKWQQLDHLTLQNGSHLLGQFICVSEGGGGSTFRSDTRPDIKSISFTSRQKRTCEYTLNPVRKSWSAYFKSFIWSASKVLSSAGVVQFAVLQRNGEHPVMNYSPQEVKLIELHSRTDGSQA